jgi:very-short-patch-repair endonuclease
VRGYTSQTLDRARSLRKNMTLPERKLWYALREKLPAMRVRRQQPIGPYIVDFYVASARLIIELDGETHANTRVSDAGRTAFLEAAGLHVLRLNNSDINQNISGALAVIAAAVEAGANTHA